MIRPRDPSLQGVDPMEESRLPEAPRREFIVGESNEGSKFPNNFVRTAKYTVLNFVPKNLFEQFMRVANLYFLVVSILQLIPGLSPTGRFTTLLPLTVVLALTACKDAYEDWKRHKRDRAANEKETQVLVDGELVHVQWQNILVGNIFRLQKNEPIPADCILLSSSDRGGLCYVETSSLDG